MAFLPEIVAIPLPQNEGERAEQSAGRHCWADAVEVESCPSLSQRATISYQPARHDGPSRDVQKTKILAIAGLVTFF